MNEQFLDGVIDPESEEGQDIIRQTIEHIELEMVAKSSLLAEAEKELAEGERILREERLSPEAFAVLSKESQQAFFDAEKQFIESLDRSRKQVDRLRKAYINFLQEYKNLKEGDSSHSVNNQYSFSLMLLLSATLVRYG